MNLWPTHHYQPFPLGILLLSSLLREYWGYQPSIAWKKQLAGMGSIADPAPRRGNGVVVPQRRAELQDGVYNYHVWITDDEGSLYTVDPNRPKKEPLVFRPIAMEGKSTVCQSSVTLVEKETTKDNEEKNSLVELAIYAVIDVPLGIRTKWTSYVTSRIFGIGGNNENGSILGSLVWSIQVKGAVVGTPQIGSHGVYVVHNDPWSEQPQGFVSMIDFHSGKMIWNVSSSIDQEQEFRSFGPLTVHRSLKQDTLYWGESTRQGYSNIGRGHILVISSSSSDDRTSIQTFYDDTNNTISSTVVAPTISRNGEWIWFAGRSASVYGGWTPNNNVPIDNEKAVLQWNVTTNKSLRNVSLPIESRLILSEDNSMLFVASASTSCYGINASNGVILWQASTQESTIATSAVVSPSDNKHVYFVEHRNGAIVQRNAQTGEEQWRFACDKFKPKNRICQDSVEADVAISSDGVHLYYVDVFGRLTSLQIAPLKTTVASTLAPTNISSMTPSVTPLAHPSAKPSASPSIMPSSKPTETVSFHPTATPSWFPSERSTEPPSVLPSALPSATPSAPPTALPSAFPSVLPSVLPSAVPSSQPSSLPSCLPSTLPSAPPSTRPTPEWTQNPSFLPSIDSYTDVPSVIPTEMFSSGTRLPPRTDSTLKEEVVTAVVSNANHQKHKRLPGTAVFLVIIGSILAV